MPPSLVTKSFEQLQTEVNALSVNRQQIERSIAEHEAAIRQIRDQLTKINTALDAYSQSYGITNFFHDTFMPGANTREDYLNARQSCEEHIKEYIKEQLRLKTELEQITKKHAWAHQKLMLQSILDNSSMPQDYHTARLQALNDYYQNPRAVQAFTVTLNDAFKEYLTDHGFNPTELTHFNGNALTERLITENLRILNDCVQRAANNPNTHELLDLTTTASMAATHAALSGKYQTAINLTNSAYYHIYNYGMALIEGSAIGATGFADTLLHPIDAVRETASGIAQIIAICLRDAINQDNISTLLLGEETGQLTEAQRQYLITSINEYREQYRRAGEALQQAWERTCAEGIDVAICRAIGYAITSFYLAPAATAKVLQTIGTLPVIQRSLTLVNNIATRQLRNFMVGTNLLINIETATPAQLELICQQFRKSANAFRKTAAVTCTDEEFVQAATTFNRAAGEGLSLFAQEIEQGGTKPTGRIKPTIGQNPLTFNEPNIQHIFRNDPGHLLDTPQNRKLILDMASDINNYYPQADRHGNIWCAKILDDGKQIWAEVRENVIINGGLNQTPKIWDPQTGLCNPVIPQRK